MVQELGQAAETEQGRVLGHTILAKYYRLRHGTIGPLRSWIDRERSVSEELVCDSRIHRLTVELGLPLIYRTNYDRNFEVVCQVAQKPFAKIANARDLNIVKLVDTQIIKFHGDFHDDDSLVLTESDYFSRLYLDTPLDVKFRAGAISRVVLFMATPCRT